jgi:hypothetical protein
VEGTDLKEELMSIRNADATQAPCKRCRGTGIVSLSRPDLAIEAGVFCDNCETGRERWNRVLELINKIETSRLTTVFIAKHKHGPTA